MSRSDVGPRVKKTDEPTREIHVAVHMCQRHEVWRGIFKQYYVEVDNWLTGVSMVRNGPAWRTCTFKRTVADTPCYAE